MTDAIAATLALTPAATPAQRGARVTVEGTVGLALVGAVAVAALLALATAGLAVSRYRNRDDPVLRAFVVGLVLTAVAPLPFRLFVAGTVPPVLRDALPPAFQTLGLAAVLWAMYGDPRSGGGSPVHRPTRGDLLVVVPSVALGVATAALGGVFGSGTVVAAVSAAVVALATFVAGQAARAAYRYRSPAMASLSVGVLCLGALPPPTLALLLAAGVVPDAAVFGAVAATVLVGEAAMFAALAYR